MPSRNRGGRGRSVLLVRLLFLVVVAVQGAASAAAVQDSEDTLPTPNWFAEQQRPSADDDGRSTEYRARVVVASANWGVLASLRPGGKIFTNVVSVSDGVNSQSFRRNATGVPYFYLTVMDETARDLLQDPQSSFTVSDKSNDANGRCGALDAQEPPCSRITLMGRVVPVSAGREQAFAREALFSKHPAMKRWPSGHDFAFYKMVIQEIFFLDHYGGAPKVSVKSYLSVRLVDDEDEEHPSSVLRSVA